MRSSIVLLTTALVALAVANPIERRNPSMSQDWPGSDDECDEGDDIIEDGDSGVSDMTSSVNSVMPTPTPSATAQPKAEDTTPPKPSVEPKSLGSAPKSGPSGGQAYIDTVMYYHNIHRANHSDTAPLVWSAKLANTAKDDVSYCAYGHTLKGKNDYPISNGQYGYGQNWMGGSKPEQIGNHINSMYNDEFYVFGDQYGQAQPQVIPNVGNGMLGHFTQMVWKGTTDVGCWTDSCNGRYETICNYFPPGNYGGQYGKNIGRPLGKPYERDQPRK